VVLRDFYYNRFSSVEQKLHVSLITNDRCILLILKPQGKKPRVRPRYRWEDNINMALREIGCKGGDLTELDKDRIQWRAFVTTVTD
jgi:hypothetical protein